jgi:hypothetical protein
MKEIDEALIKEFTNLLDNESALENDIQTFLENNSLLIPLPFLNGHHLHFGAIISKFKIGNEFVSDFAYLTKCSDHWDIVLMEIEDPKKKLFTNDKENNYFSADFNHAYDQITSWKAYLNDNKERVLHKFDKIRVPLGQNPTGFKYVLIIGRNNEKEGYVKRTAMFNQKNSSDVKVMTFDSVISFYKHYQYRSNRLILTPWKEQGFKIKIVPDDLSTSIFTYMSPEYLKIEDDNIEKLKLQDFRIDSWLNGKPLEFNEKYDRETFYSEIAPRYFSKKEK